MSIVTDALKKARKEFEIKDKSSIAISNIKEEKPTSPNLYDRSEKRWMSMLVISLAIVASLLGSIFLYKNMPRLNVVYNAGVATSRSNSEIQNTLNQIDQKNISSGIKVEDVAKLNGIVYGQEGKWAIINNKIFREGDVFLNGKITAITKEFVKIEKADGNEVVLNLK